jgi:hypothetical protein
VKEIQKLEIRCKSSRLESRLVNSDGVCLGLDGVD